MRRWEHTDSWHRDNGIHQSPNPRLPSTVYRLRRILRLPSAVYCLLYLLLTACTAGRPLPWQTNQTSPVQPTTAAVLPQPTTAIRTREPPGASRSAAQIVDVYVTHVRDLNEVLVRAGDPVQIGQPLATLTNYAEELDRHAQRIALELEQAQAKLAAARQDVGTEQERQTADAAAQVTALERHVVQLQRRQQIANARLAETRATTAYRQRWLDVLEPLDEFDPWGDIPYLVGSQSGPQGPRSDLAYREAVAQAAYDLRRAELAQQIAELEAAAAAAELQQAQANLGVARTTLSEKQAVEEQSDALSLAQGCTGTNLSQLLHLPAPADLCTYVASVRINELRLAQAQAEKETTVVRSLVAGQVLDVQVDRVVDNDATVIIRIMPSGGSPP